EERFVLRAIDGGLLVQEPDRVLADRSSWRVVTKAQPTDQNWRDIELAWRICAWVKSNAIVLVNEGMAVGIGAGQQNRVEPGEIAAKKAAGRAEGGVCPRDALFPVRDGLDVPVAAGVTAEAPHGGSLPHRAGVAAAH